MILAGDIGGTKTVLALYTFEHGKWQCCGKQRYASADYATFTELLQLFLLSFNNPNIATVSIGVAGPIVNGDCRATNLPWILLRTEISQCVGSRQVYLLNDLEAAAWGALALPESSFIELNPDAKAIQGNHAVIAAGTGLGEAIIAWDGVKHHVMASEGGHCDFAPRNEQEIALLNYMLQKHPDHVSYERIVSGEGIVNIYRFLEQSAYASANTEITKQLLLHDAAAIISNEGVAERDALCTETMRLFCELYGAEAANLVLKCLPYGGIYLAGGIAGKVLPLLQAGHFMTGFLAKGRYKTMLQHISVKVCMDSDVALTGALSYAKQMT